MDIFLEDYIDTDIVSTPNIEFQLDKYNDKEYFSCKYIPEEALFASVSFINKLKMLYNNLDMPILVYGAKGCGKITAILGLINNTSLYCPNNISLENEEELGICKASFCEKINNVYFMKILDKDYEKILVYENVYYLNINILSNATEITIYIKYIYKLSRGVSIDGTKKIIIISNIDKCNIESQKYINYMLDKLNGNAVYIFTTSKINNLIHKIKSSCVNINFGYLNETEFIKIFSFNYKKTKQEYLASYYKIYCNTQYNIGNTIAQIKYIIDTKINILDTQANGKGNGNIYLYTHSLMYNIVKNFIKKYLKLSSIHNALDIRKFIYTLLSLNFDLLNFAKELITQLLDSKLNTTIKELLITKSGVLSLELNKINKEVIIIEKFIYDVIYIIYS